MTRPTVRIGGAVQGGGGGGGVPSGLLAYTNARRADSAFFIRGAHWKFDEGAGATAADSSGNANNLTLNAPYTWIAGGAPDGTSPSLQLGNGFATTALTTAQSHDFSLTFASYSNIGINAGWTLFMRVKPTAAASAAAQLVARKQQQPATFNAGSWLFGVMGTGANVGKFVFATQGGSNYYSTGRIDDGNWHDIVLIKDLSLPAEFARLYVDGAYNSTIAAINPWPDAANHSFDFRNEGTGGETPELAEMAFLPLAIPLTVPALLWNGGGGGQRRLDDTATGLIEIAKV